MIGLIGVIEEDDYIRYAQKFIKQKKDIEENINTLKNKITILTSSEKKDISNQEVKEKTKNFLHAEFINKEILFDIVDRIEVDENKKIYVHFNFEQLNIYDDEVIQNVSFS